MSTSKPPQQQEDKHHQQHTSPLSLTHNLHLLAPFEPASATRAWLSAPHPTLPLVATCSSDRCVRVYSLRTFRLHSTIEGGHKRSVRTCAWKPSPPVSIGGLSSSVDRSTHERYDGVGNGGGGESVLVTGSFDASAGVWRRWNEGVMEQSVLDSRHNNDEDEDEEDGWRFAVILEGHDSEIKSVAWSCAGNSLATCSRDKSVWIWEEIGDQGGIIGGGGETSMGGGRLGGGGGGGDDDFETVAVLQDHEADVKCVAWHPTDNHLLASASYDETIRLYREDEDENDWLCVAVLRGHEGTVWFIDFEGGKKVQRGNHADEEDGGGGRIEEPRLISCSDDLTIRVWRRQRALSSSNTTSTNGAAGDETHSTDKAVPPTKKYPSTIRPSSHSTDEDWIQESILPRRHDRAVYCVSWSKRSGRVVSTGGDGRIVVYEERLISDYPPSHDEDENETENHTLTSDADAGKKDGRSRNENGRNATEWIIIAEMEAAHGVYEINHVCWARRFDHLNDYHHNNRNRHGGTLLEDETTERKKRGDEKEEEEEVILSTGDDGVVNIWRIH